MVNWKNHLDLHDLWKSFQGCPDEDAKAREVGPEVARRLRKVFPNPEPDLLLIVIAFEHEVTDVETFDELIDELYDWGDLDYRLWVNIPRVKT